MAVVNYNFELQLFMEQAQEEHVAQFRQMKQAGKDLLDSIAILNQRRLPRGLFSDDRLRQILSEVEIMVKKQYPDYELAATHISHYCDMKMVTFVVDQRTHSLIVVFPAFIKDYKQPPLALFEIESVPVPIRDKNKLADSFSQVVIEKPYLAAGKDYYIQLPMTELAMCKDIRYIYYCEELFVVKHKSKHSCASAIFYNLGLGVVTENCKFHYMYNATVTPVILDGGREVLLANFYGQRSLKCASQNGGLAKPIPEHMYAVVQREFLCDCQLDLKHTSVLHRLNACSGSKPQNLVMKFVVNLAFWEMLKKRHAKLSEKVQPKVDFVEQTFDVRLFDDDKNPLNTATDMLRMINKMDEDGKKHDKKKAEYDDLLDEVEVKPLLPKFLANILIVVCSVLSTLATIVVILVLVKYCKMSSILATLIIDSQLPPPVLAILQLPGPVGIMAIACHTLIDGLQSTGMADDMPHNSLNGLPRAVHRCEKFMTLFNKIYNDTAQLPPMGMLMQVQEPSDIPEKTCGNQLFPWLSFLNIILATIMLGHGLYCLCRPLTWYYGYEFKRCCSLYLFMYNGDNYTPIKVKTLRGHMNCYKIEDNRKDMILTLHKNWIFDTVSINWNGVRILEEDEPIPLPTSVLVLLKHKVKTRNILSQDYEIQYSIKQGTNWLNMTKHYRSARRGFVKKACESIEMIPLSADKNVNHKMQPNLV